MEDQPLIALLGAPLLALTQPDRRIFLPFLLTALAIGVGTTLRQTGWAGVRALFARRIWLHPSALVDYRLIAIKALLRAVLFPGFVLSTIGLAVVVAAALRRGLGIEVVPGLSPLTTGAALTLAAFVADDWSRYALHRLMHRVPALWALHRVHHSAEVLTPLTLYRTHPLESALNQARGVLVYGSVTGVALALAGPSVQAWQVLGVDALGFVFGLLGANLRHSSVWLSYGRRWGRVLISPAQHQVHHSAAPGHLDRNYGEVLAVWDLLGGTLYVTSSEPESLELGLPAQERAPQRALDLLLAPLVTLGRWLARTPRLVRLLPLLLLAAGCGGKRFDFGALASSLGECSLEVYRANLLDATKLESAVAAYAAEPTSTTHQAAQAAWRDAMDRWQEAEMLQFGPLASTDTPGGLGLREGIYAWPNVNRCLIDQQLVARTYEAATFAAIPGSTRGLGALEYLLFYGGPDNGCGATVTINAQGSWAALSLDELAQRRAAYARAVATDLTQRIAALVAAWDGGFLAELQRAGKGSTVFVNQTIAIHTVAAALYHVDTDQKDLKLGAALGFLEPTIPGGPEAFESTWAGRSRPHLLANLRGLDRLVHGCKPVAKPLGFDDWLRAVGAGSIADNLAADLLSARAALEALPHDDLRLTLAADRPAVQGLYEAFKRLSDDIKLDLTATLQIKPPVRVESDND